MQGIPPVPLKNEMKKSGVHLSMPANVYVYMGTCASSAELRHWVMSAKLNGEHTLAHIFLTNFSHKQYRSIRWIHLSPSLNYARFCSYRCIHHPSHSLFAIRSIASLLILLTYCLALFRIRCAGAHNVYSSLIPMQIVSVCVAIGIKASISITKKYGN